MIVHTMTELQIRQELMKDIVEVNSLFIRKSKAYRRRVVKTTDRRLPLIVDHDWVSPRNNKWLLYQLSENRKQYGGKEKRKYACIAHDSKGRKSAYEFYIYSKSAWVIRFSAHFFDRYRERMRYSEKGDELIKRFFKQNRSYMIGSESLYLLENEEYEAAVFCEDGVGLGRLQGVMIAVATFIPKRYFSKGQKEVYKSFKDMSETSWLSIRELLHKMEETGLDDWDYIKVHRNE